MKIKLYGRLADVVGHELEIECPLSCSIGQLRRKLVNDFPDARGLLLDNEVRACVDNHIVGDDYLLSPADTVEFLPPVSGG